MKKTNDKEKSIKPQYWPSRPDEGATPPPGEKSLSYAPAWLWPNVPEDCDYAWVQVVRDWLCEIVPGGTMTDYLQVKLNYNDLTNEMKINKVRVDLYSHTYWYFIEFTENWIFTKVLERKPRAGTDSTYHTIDQYHGKNLTRKIPFSFQSWYFLKNVIMRNEFVKVVNQARTEEEWKKMNSRYKTDGQLYYSEWEQREGQIRNHKKYQMSLTEETCEPDNFRK